MRLYSLSHDVRCNGKVDKNGGNQQGSQAASVFLLRPEEGGGGTLWLFAEKCGSWATCRAFLRLCEVAQPWLEFLRVGRGGDGKSARENSARPTPNSVRGSPERPGPITNPCGMPLCASYPRNSNKSPVMTTGYLCHAICRIRLNVAIKSLLFFK